MMIENLSSWWHVLRQFTNPFYIIGTAVMWALIAFAVMTTVVLIFRKKILVRRRYGVLKVFAWVYLFAIPLLAGLFGLKYGVVRGIHKDLYLHTVAYTGGMDMWLNASFGKEIKAFTMGGVPGATGFNTELSTNDVIDKLSTIAYLKYGSTLEHQLLSENKSESIFAGLLLKATKSKGISWATKQGLHTTFKKTLGIDEKVSTEVMDTKIQALLDAGIFSTVLRVQLDKIFGGMARGVLITFCLILLLPLTEILIAHWLVKKQIRQETDLQFEQQL